LKLFVNARIHIVETVVLTNEAFANKNYNIAPTYIAYMKTDRQTDSTTQTKNCQGAVIANSGAYA